MKAEIKSAQPQLADYLNTKVKTIRHLWVLDLNLALKRSSMLLRYKTLQCVKIAGCFFNAATKDKKLRSPSTQGILLLLKSSKNTFLKLIPKIRYTNSPMA